MRVCTTPQEPPKNIMIDAGHPSYDGDRGAHITLATGGVLFEDILNEDLADEVRYHLEGAGFVESYPSHEPFETASLSERQDRARLVDAGFVVSIHHNASSNPAHSGMRVFHNSSPTAKAAAQVILDSAPRGLKHPGRHPTHMDVKGWERVANVLRGYTCPAILVEVGYMTNPQDLELIQDPRVQFGTTLAICSGIVRFLQESK